MVNGRLNNIGTLNSLEKTYSKGKLVVLNTSKKEEENINKMILKVFPDATLQDNASKYQDSYRREDTLSTDDSLALDVDSEQSQRCTMVVNIPEENFDFFVGFSFFDKLMELNTISQYSIKNNSFFSNYAAMQ